MNKIDKLTLNLARAAQDILVAHLEGDLDQETSLFKNLEKALNKLGQKYPQDYNDLIIPVYEEDK